MSQNLDGTDFDQPVDEKPKRDQQTENKPDNSSGRVIGAIALIALGVVFLLRQYGVNIPLFENWWALFILIPAVGALWSGFSTYHRTGYWTNEARGAIGGGTMIALVGLILLFQFDWGKVWPLFLIVPGVLLLLGMWGPDRRHIH